MQLLKFGSSAGVGAGVGHAPVFTIGSVRQASVPAGRRSGNTSRLPLPEPFLAAMSTSQRGRQRATGTTWIRQSEPGRVHTPFCGPGNSLKGIRRDRHHGHCCSGCVLFFGNVNCVSLGAPHWRAGSLLASTALGKQVPYVLRHTGVVDRYRPGEDGNPRDQCGATPREVWSPTR